jgi:hypothetical protein
VDQVKPWVIKPFSRAAQVGIQLFQRRHLNEGVVPQNIPTMPGTISLVQRVLLNDWQLQHTIVGNGWNGDVDFLMGMRGL